ncbi:MAG: PqqD family protein [Candidatus Aminicenantes bacterium]|nr:PqqD family protein [Candidatus Aminicenantes bacterium]
MSDKIDLGKVYAPSEDIVVREIEGEVVIVPLVSGIGDMEDELFTLNETGRDIWNKIDGSRTVAAVVRELAEEYDAPAGLLEELLVRKMVVEKE